jgi:hypothetical protein
MSFTTVSSSVLLWGLALSPVGVVLPGDVQADLHVEPEVDQVAIPGWVWDELQRANRPDPPEEAPAAVADERRVTLRKVAGGLEVQAAWTIRSGRGGWWGGTLLGLGTPGDGDGVRIRRARFAGRPVSVAPTPTGHAVAMELPPGRRGTLTFSAFVPTDRLSAGVDLRLLPAVRGSVIVDAPAYTPVLEGSAETALGRADGQYWTGTEHLHLRLDPAEVAGPVASAGALAEGRSALGLTFGDGAVRARAHLQWVVRRGSLEHVTVRITAAAPDLTVVGPNVREWTRNGDELRVALQNPADGKVDLHLQWSQTLPTGDEASLPGPLVSATGVWRDEAFVQIARDGEVEVLPELPGSQPIAATELPQWAEGLIEGTPTASFRRGDEGGSFGLLRFVPVSGPPAVIDIAAYEIAMSDEGRALVKARFDVRNERASHLVIRPPEGAQIIGVRVGGEVVTPSRDGADGWRVPLLRSLESVEGLLSFPVEAIVLGDGSDWKRKERRTFGLPSVDAPVAVSRVRVFLPPGYESRLESGEHHVVRAFSEGEGITYGLGSGDDRVEAADEIYRSALSSYLSNDFDTAQAQLDELADLGASNANVAGLQANLDVISGEQVADDDATAGKASLAVRRVKEQARTRAVGERRNQLEIADQAEVLEAEGRYEEAERKLAEAIEIGDRLARLEQAESVEQSSYNAKIRTRSSALADKRSRKTKRERDARFSLAKGKKKRTISLGSPRPPSPSSPSGSEGSPASGQPDASDLWVDGARGAQGGGDGAVVRRELEPEEMKAVYEFEDDDLEGELIQPEGAELRQLAGVDPASPGSAIAARARTAAGPAFNTAVIGEAVVDNIRQHQDMSQGVRGVPQTKHAGLAPDALSAGEVEPPVGPTPMLAPPHPIDEAAVSETVATRAIEEKTEMHLDGDLSRDFTAVVDVASTATRDAAGISLAGSTAAVDAPEPEPAMDDAPASGGRFARAAGAIRGVFRRATPHPRRRGRAKAAAPPAPAKAPRVAEPDRTKNGGSPAEPPSMPVLDPNAALAGPVSHASALSVVIPQIGETVLYQHMLLPAGEPLTVHVEARARPDRTR